jgi:hypothetical protein
MIIPTRDITVSEKQKLKAREETLDAVAGLKDVREVWVKINQGLFKGTIFRAPLRGSGDDLQVYLRVETYQVGHAAQVVDYMRGRNAARQWVMVDRYLNLNIHSGYEPKPIRLPGGIIIPSMLSRDVTNSMSILLDYQGSEEFHMDFSKRPPTFQDRLGQDVEIGDLVVVALNYGAGLDVCMVRGYADERRVLIESVEGGGFDRIALDKNATNKIMRMPNSLRDTAMMMKLARD